MILIVRETAVGVGAAGDHLWTNPTTDQAQDNFLNSKYKDSGQGINRWTDLLQVADKQTMRFQVVPVPRDQVLAETRSAGPAFWIQDRYCDHTLSEHRALCSGDMPQGVGKGDRRWSGSLTRIDLLEDSGPIIGLVAFAEHVDCCAAGVQDVASLRYRLISL